MRLHVKAFTLRTQARAAFACFSMRFFDVIDGVMVMGDGPPSCALLLLLPAIQYFLWLMAAHP